jgi:hypothetical protein
MGFNRAARREAAAQQEAARRQQQAAHDRASAQATEYQASFNKRNAGIIDIRDRGISFLDRYSKGRDINELIPASIANSQAAADTVRNTMSAAGRMGDASQLPNDAGYQSRLNSVMGASLGRGLAAINDQRLASEVGQQTSNVASASSFLNADSQAGLGLNNTLFSMTDTIWQNATTRRDMEIRVAQQAFGNMMSVVSAGVGFATGAFGASGFLRGLGRRATTATPTTASIGYRDN